MRNRGIIADRIPGADIQRPERTTPIGYAALIEAYDLSLPLPPRHAVDATLAAQSPFAIKWEGVDLAVLAQLFNMIEAKEIVTRVKATPTGAFARRIWFLYKWLTDRTLDLPDAGKVRMVDVVEPEQ